MDKQDPEFSCNFTGILTSYVCCGISHHITDFIPHFIVNIMSFLMCLLHKCGTVSVPFPSVPSVNFIAMQQLYMFLNTYSLFKSVILHTHTHKSNSN
jgi:hypothetical protein